MHCLSKEADLGIPACMTIDECCLYNNFQKFVALNKSYLNFQVLYRKTNGISKEHF